MQMHVEACQNQMQVLGIMARLLCQFFGSGTDGLGSGAGLGTLPPQVLHHDGGLGNVKPDANSPSELSFMVDTSSCGALSELGQSVQGGCLCSLIFGFYNCWTQFFSVPLRCYREIVPMFLYV
ncbi:hypothetical protein E2542_SST21184 [Spatholobus suberectus]|nr:hypothetical protein E2542_SST21184 [Spatholobus suberectus]